MVQDLPEDFHRPSVPVEHGLLEATLLDKFQGALVGETAVEEGGFFVARGKFEKPAKDLSLERLFDPCFVVEAHLSESDRGGKVFLNKGQCLIDRFRSDFPWMVTDGRVDITRVLTGQGENSLIRLDRHAYPDNGHNTCGPSLRNGLL